MKKYFFALVIVAINLAVIITAGEMYARIKHAERLKMRAEEIDYRRSDLVLHHSLRPGATGRSVTGEWDVEYRINALGLRDAELDTAKPEGVYRILLLGDSFTEGYGVSAGERFSDILESSLEQEDGSFEVVNAGVASYSPLLEYIYLRENGLELEPDMVVLFYDLGDLRDDLEYENITEFDKGGFPVACAPLKRVRAISDNPLERFLARHSRFYLYLENKVNNLVYKLGKGEEGETYGEDDPADFNRFVAFHAGPDLIGRLWQRSRRYLDLIHDMLKQRGIDMVLAVYPFAVEIDGMEWSEGREEYGFKVGRVYPRPGIRGMIKKYAEDRGIRFIDMHSYMEEAGDGPLYFAFDGHFTPKGHEVMGKGLSEEFRVILEDKDMT